MDQATSPPATPPSAPRAWRPARRSQPIPQHDWQVELPPERSTAPRWRPLRLALWFALLSALFACFLVVALDAPERTPLLIMTDVRPGPIPQTPWLAEEIERLKLLDRTTLSVYEHSPSLPTGTSVADFRQSLQQMTRAADRTGAVIVYLRLPGLVDDVGRPCLIPSQASLFRSEEWLPVEALLDHIAGDVFPKHVQRLVIVDRCQPDTVWPAGILADSFGDQLASLVKRQHEAGRWQTLRVLSDTTGHQTGWHSPALGGSVFGEAIWSALTGRANSAEAGGNGDRHVSLSEMANYVTRRTSDWVWENRRQVQTPSLLSPDLKNYQLFWAAPESTQHVWHAAADRLRTPVDRDASLHRLKQMWSERLALADQAPWRFDPVAWQRLNHLVVQYEVLTNGGASAARQREDVERAIQSLLETLGNAARSRSPLGEGDVRLPHRQLAQRLNPDRPADGARVADAFDQVRRRPSRQVAAALLHDLQQKGAIPQYWDLVVLQHLANDAPDSSWSQPELISRVLSVMESLGEMQASPNSGVSVMLESQCRPIEATLRVILDCLFVGTDDRLATAVELAASAEKRLADCRQSEQDLLKAIEWRDRAAADLPRLAEWIYIRGCGEARTTAKRGVGDWIAATGNWKQLEAALAQCADQGASPESASLAASLATQLERELSELWTHVEQAYDRLLTGAADAAAVAEMEQLLSTSLIPREPDSLSRTPVEQRMTLRETWLQASTQIAIQFAARSPGDQHAETIPPTALDDWMIQIARGAAPHPMFAMLSLTETRPHSPGASSESLHDQLLSRSWQRSVRIRHELASIPQGLHRSRYSSFDSPIARERAWRVQAQRVRTAASWLPNNLPYNPCHRLELAACGRLLRNRAACMADDFWAGSADNGPPFFVQAAGELLDCADLCDADWRDSLNEAGKAEANQTRRLLAASQNPSQAPLGVTAIAVPQILASDDLQTNVDVRRSPQAVLPPGTAAVFISRGDKTEEWTVGRESADLSTPSNGTRDFVTTRISLQNPLPKTRIDTRQSRRAYAYFRGHRFADDFQLAPTAGFTVRSVPGADVPATVTVQSDRRRPTAILFVLDASASMTDNVTREGTRGTIRKIDAAVDALNSLLNDLADENNVQVGVVFYGHRVAAGETAAAGVQRQPLYEQRFPFSPTLQPFEDVETVLPVGRFGPAELGRMDARLRALQPWGETPLYLSILEGLEQLESAPADATRTMVVITDGLNYQFNPTPEKRTELQDVLRSVEGREVAVHLLGFGIAEKEIAQAREEFSRISAATGGSSDVTVRDAARLQARLRSLYQPGRFSIQNGDAVPKTAQVGEPIVLAPNKSGERPYDVRYESATGRIAIEGGEKLIFRPALDGTLRIVSDLPYLTASLRERDSGLDSPCDLAASRPEWKGNDLVIRWSLRQRDGQFTPRPAIGYFLIQPIDANGRELGAAALCLGPAAVPGQPLPTWEFRIPSWPRDAVTARMQGWVGSRPMSVDRTESYVSLIQRQQNNESWQALPIPAVGWQIRHDVRSVTLVERYDTAAGEPQVWTELTENRLSQGAVDTSHAATLLSVDRRYDAEHHLFVQTWNFDRELAPEDLNRIQFRFTSLEPIRSRGWMMGDSLLLSTVPQALVIKPVPVMTR
ncbi:MAG: hypothetical protein IT428_28445 [Planctomycetaceae bacterium]|nr:hypothetical protein [Planctomycetaceae bacterium]